MSILIKGMKKPEHCGYCRFRYDGICHALQKTQYAVKDCPLIELPDHGDLKDVNAIIQDVYDALDRMTKIGVAVDADWIWAKFHDAIYSAPVVIPAERSENDEH